MKIWKGETSNVTDAQKAFAHRLRLNSAARAGRYNIEMERIQSTLGQQKASLN